MNLEAYVNQEEGKYIPVLEFVNNLYKEARPQVPLKKIVEHLGRQNLFTNLALYKKDGYDYFLVTPTDLLKFENSTEIVKSIYDSLDHNQIGITFDKDNLKAFKGFYFKFSDALRLYEYAKLNPPEVETVNSTVFKPDDNIVSFLGKYQRLLINYKLFTPDQIVCLMIDENPACISHDDKYHAHWDMVSNALDANQLTPINEKEQIKAEQVKTWLASCGFIYTGFNDHLSNSTNNASSLSTDLTISAKDYEQMAQDLKAAHSSIEQLNQELTAANVNIKALESELKAANKSLADKPTDSVTHSNTDIHNAKQAAIKQFNRSLAMALIELDYQRKLRKQDIVNFIMPYMKELTFILADENEERANSLIVSYNTLYDTHLQGLNFKKGNQSNKDKERQTIELLFKKQLPVTE